MPKLIESTIKDVTKAFEVKILPNIIKLALICEGFTSKRADLIMRWAQASIGKDKS